jgi:hypothetical protein
MPNRSPDYFEDDWFDEENQQEQNQITDSFNRREMPTSPDLSIEEMQRQLEQKGFEQLAHMNLVNASNMGKFLDARDFCIRKKYPFKVVKVGTHYVLWAKQS